MKKEGYLILSGKVRWQTVLYFLQTITGLFLTSFLFVHFLGVSTVWGGSRWFNWYTAHLDKNNFFIKAAVFLIFGIFLAHAANGFKIIWGYFLKTLKVYKYLADMNYRGSWLWYVHFLSGVCIFALGIIHLYIAYWGHNVTTAAMAAKHLQDGFYFGSLIALLIFAFIHSLCGIRSILIKYGILLRKRGIVNFILIAIGANVLFFGILNLFLLFWA
ncbi:MAG: hypothetical protein US76_04225 [Parcubacteria group bacterium GW2011_GWA2_38_13b]|nr:MAG: hypothetical protein US76_04225 [Parcubacteria group bacterium GW2011_GWA2_38_13b]